MIPSSAYSRLSRWHWHDQTEEPIDHLTDRINHLFDVRGADILRRLKASMEQIKRCSYDRERMFRQTRKQKAVVWFTRETVMVTAIETIPPNSFVCLDGDYARKGTL